jgi:hypothetical protein
VREYLEAQRRYRGLTEADLAALEREVGEGWQRLEARTRMELTA